MKLHFTIVLLALSMGLFAQQSASLNYGTSIAIDEVDIEFVEVLEDSRCPANVNCIQAGKAVVLVNVYADGKFLGERKLEFNPGGFHNLNNTTLYDFEGLRITGMTLLPYPVALSKTPKEDYFLEMTIDY